MDASLRLHPWSVGFAWSDLPSPGRRLNRHEVDQFNADGYVILRSALPIDLVEAMRTVTDEAERAQATALAEVGGRSGISEGGAITFGSGLVVKYPVLRQVAGDALFVELALDLIGPDVDLYHDQLVYKKYEKPRRFPWHQDNGYAFITPQHYLTCWIPLVEATRDNGCPQLVPGVHRLGTLEHTYVDPLGWQCFQDPPAEPVLAEVAPGDVILFSSLSPHLTGPNLTESVRKAYILQYSAAGCTRLIGDPKAGPPADTVPVGHAPHQFPVARGGKRIELHHD